MEKPVNPEAKKILIEVETNGGREKSSWKQLLEQAEKNEKQKNPGANKMKKLISMIKIWILRLKTTRKQIDNNR